MDEKAEPIIASVDVAQECLAALADHGHMPVVLETTVAEVILMLGAVQHGAVALEKGGSNVEVLAAISAHWIARLRPIDVRLVDLALNARCLRYSDMREEA